MRGSIFMEYASIYRRFRPTTFDDVIGQKHVVRTLTNQIKNGNVGHAYLFTGTRGTGKTSCAKIFARAVNCLHPVNGSPCGECEVCRALIDNASTDVIEMDAASNNGVDEIRTLKENVMYRPTIGKYKVYIIDEVHMLTGSAFNALLKTLEEPPEHVIFILATTEVQKLPQTILSRCIRFDFRLVEVNELVALLKRIFDELGVTYDERALTKIAIQGEGSVRDTLSVADMCMSYCGKYISYEDALEILCATDFSTLDSLVTAILDGDVGKSLTVAETLLRNGRNTLARDIAHYCNQLISIKNIPSYKPDSVTETEYKVFRARAEDYSNFRISSVMQLMAGVESQLRYSSQPRILLEATIVKAALLTEEVNVDGVLNRVRELEDELRAIKATGVKVRAESVAPAAPAEQTTSAPSTETKPKVDVTAILSGVAKEEDELVFTEEEDVSDNGIAQEIWSRVKEMLNAGNEGMISVVCDSLDKISIRNDEFIIKVEDKASYELINRPNNRALIASLIQKTSGKDYKLTIVMPETNRGISPDSRARLNDMFSGKIKFKK